MTVCVAVSVNRGHRTSTRRTSVSSSRSDSRVREDGSSEEERFLESDRDNEERKGFSEKDGVDVDLEVPGGKETEHEGEAGRGEGKGGEPETEGSGMRSKREGESAHVQVKRNEGRMHEDVSDQHDEDVGRVRFLFHCERQVSGVEKAEKCETKRLTLASPQNLMTKAFAAKSIH